MCIKEKYLVLLLVFAIFSSGCNKIDKAVGNDVQNENNNQNVQLTETPIPTELENIIETSIKKEETYLTKTPMSATAEKIHITELKCNNGDMFEEIEQFKILFSKPYILSNGKAYTLKDGSWIEVVPDDNLVEIYDCEDDDFNALNDKGQVILKGEDELDKIKKELEEGLDYISEVGGNVGAGYGAEVMQAESIIEKSKSKPIKSLSDTVFRPTGELVLFKNGDLSMIQCTEEVPIKDIGEVKKILYSYVLTCDGDLYSIIPTEDEDYAKHPLDIKKLPDENIVDIYEGSNRVTAVKEDGTIILWDRYVARPEESIINIDDADVAEAYAVGRKNYITVNKNGEILFHTLGTNTYYKELERNMNTIFAERSKKILKIAVRNCIISILNEDMTVTVISY